MASQPAARRQYYILLFISFILRVRAVRLFLHNILYICGLCMYNDVGITDLLLFNLVLYNDIMLMGSASSLYSQIGGAARTPTGLEKARDHRGTSRRVCLNIVYCNNIILLLIIFFQSDVMFNIHEKASYIDTLIVF